MKKSLLIIIVVIGVLLILAGGVFLAFNKRRTQSPGGSQNEEVVTEVALEDRPFVTLTPREDGKELTLEVSNIGETSTIEYELVYLSQGLSRGVVGSIEYKGEASVSRKILLGSCSKNVCKYDEGVEEGTLTLRLRGQEGTKRFTADFHLQKGVKELTSVDGNFKLSGSFPQGLTFVTMSTIGLPPGVGGKVIAGPYGVFATGTNNIKNAKVEFTISPEDSTAKIYYWNNKSWSLLTGSVQGSGVFALTKTE